MLVLRPQKRFGSKSPEHPRHLETPLIQDTHAFQIPECHKTPRTHPKLHHLCDFMRSKSPSTGTLRQRRLASAKDCIECVSTRAQNEKIAAGSSTYLPSGRKVSELLVLFRHACQAPTPGRRSRSLRARPARGPAQDRRRRENACF